MYWEAAHDEAAPLSAAGGLYDAFPLRLREGLRKRRRNTSSSDVEVSAPTESIPAPNEQETPGESKPSQPSADGVEVDLTVLSSTMVYSEVYNMLYNDPAHYLGKTVKARGEFSIYQLVTDGVLQPDPVSYACIISDAAACCAEGMEFVLEGDLTYPDGSNAIGC